MSFKPYPLIFEPRFVRGSSRGLSGTAPDWFAKYLKTCNLPPPESQNYDQCWLLIDSGEMQSTVQNGDSAGCTIRQLVQTAPRELVGREQKAEAPFPLCIRLFATFEDQPLQVHAGEEAPWELRCEHGNKKAWYCLAVQPESRAFVGISPAASTQLLLNQLHTPEGPRFMQKFKMRPGDSCLVPPGIIHSLSVGHLIWEIASTPLPPLRLARWREENPIPNKEKEKARQCLKQESRQNTRSARVRGSFSYTRKIPLTRHWPYFSLEEIRIADHIYLDTNKEACHLLYPVSGKITLQSRQQEDIDLPPGRVCCVPASLGQYKLISDEHAEILRAAPPWQ